MPRGAFRRKYVLTEPGRQLLLNTYDGRSETITQLTKQLSTSGVPIPRWTVTHWAQELGLARQKEPDWTVEEEKYLQDWLHRKSIPTIAKHLNRTQTAVKLKAQRLGVRKTSEGYTMTSLCQALGCDHRRIEKWIASGWLKGTRRNTERQEVQGGDIWLFTDTAVRAFIKEHANEVDPRRVEWLWLVSVLCGKEK